MLEWIRSRLTYANVTATVALFIALGVGTAYGVAKIGSADVINESLKGVDVKNRSLGGEDLGVRVRSDQQVDDGSPASTCGQGADFDECITVFFNVPRPQRLLLIGSADWGGHRAPDTNRGECRLSVPGLPDLGLRKFGQRSETGADLQHRYTVALNAVTPVLDASGYEIAIDCRQTAGLVSVKNAQLSVVALGDG